MPAREIECYSDDDVKAGLVMNSYTAFRFVLNDIGQEAAVEMWGTDTDEELETVARALESKPGTVRVECFHNPALISSIKKTKDSPSTCFYSFS